MNKLLKNQLKLYLSTPLFYIVAAVFVIFEYAVFFIKQQFFAGTGTSDLLLFFSNVPYICILVIPALCYKTNFTIYDDFLPYSRLKKYTVNFLYIFLSYLLLILLLLPGIIVVNCCGSVDAGQVFASLTGLIFYGAAAVSVCLLLQTAAPSPVISFFLSAVVLAVINSSHLFAVYISAGPFLSELTKKISFAWHFDAASKGILDTRDITFYAGLTALLSHINILTREKKAGKIWQKNQKIKNILILTITVLFIFNGNNWYKRLDLSKSKTYSLSKYTRQLAAKVNKPVKITYYRSAALNKLYPQIRDVSDFLATYQTLNRNLSFQIKDPDKEHLTDLLDSYGIYSQQLRSVSGNSTEFTNVYSAIVMEYNGNAEVIPFTMSAQTLEYDLDGRLLHLISGADRTVNIILGNGMTLSEDYSYVVPYLTSQGFICNQLFVQDPSFTDFLAATTGPLLIIGDEYINIENAIAIENYLLQNRGNALFTVSPYNARIEDDWSLHFNKNCNLVDMLESWGVGFSEQIAADLSCARITMYSQDTTTTTKNINYGLWVSLLPQKNCSAGVTEFWPVALHIQEDSVVQPLLWTSPYAYTYQIDRYNKESLIQTNPFVLEEMGAGGSSGGTGGGTGGSDGIRGSLAIGAVVDGILQGYYNDYSSSAPVKAYVIPDQYFLNSLMNEYIGGEYGDYRNYDYLTNLLLKLNGEEELAKLQGRSVKDTSLYKITDVTKLITIKNTAYLCFFGIIPAALLVLYFTLGRKGFRRKGNGKKQKN